MSSRPVLVLGIGGAGCAMLSAIAQFVDEEQISDDYRLIAIDSSSRDLREVAPSSAQKYQLDIDRELPADDGPSMDYLHGQPSFVPEAGTSRQRPLGRYLVDSSADAVGLVDQIDETIEDFLDEHPSSERDSLQVWIVNSLGGGTGSGAFPLLTLLLRKCCLTVNRSTEIYGIGSLPRLDNLDAGIESPAGEPVHYANAYAALRELRTLLNIDDNTEYPLDISIDASPSSIKANSISVTQNPFNAYWLFGVEENRRLEPSHYDRMNRLVARLIHYIASANSRDWFQQGRLYSVAGTTVKIPAERLHEYNEAEEALERLDEKLASVRDQREKLERAESQLSAVLQFDTEDAAEIASEAEGDKTPHPSLPIGREIIEVCQQTAAEFDPVESEDISIEVSLEEAHQAVAHEIDIEFPQETTSKLVVRYFITVFALERTRREIAEHTLPHTLEQMHNKWLFSDNQAVDSETLHQLLSEPFDHWYEEVMDGLKEKRRELKKEIEDSAVPAALSSAGKRLKKLEEDIARAELLSEEYERLSTFEEFLQSEQHEIRSELRAQERELEDRAASERDRWEEVQQRWARHSQRSSQIEQGLQEIRWQKGRIYLPIQQIKFEDENENMESALRTSTLRSLVDSEILDPEGLANSLREVLMSLEEPIEDQLESNYGKTDGRLGLLTSSIDEELFRELFEDGDGPGTESLRSELYYRFEKLDEMVHWQRNNTFYFLAIYSPLSLEYTSEFETIHEYFTDPEEDVSSLFSSISDTDIERRFAYPELILEE